MFCPKCGHELPENSKFCTKCGTAQPDMTETAQEPKYEQPRKEAPAYKASDTKRTGLAGDPYRYDPRFKAMMVYVFSQLTAALVSVVIMCGFCMSDGMMLDIYYDYIDKYRHHISTWAFLAAAFFWWLVCGAVALIVSYICLKKHFHSSKAALGIIMFGSLEIGEAVFTNVDVDILFVRYFMKKYGQIAKSAWILPVIFMAFIVFIIPRMM